jgi:NAD-dependent SIR2 family protein deacetylase
MVDESSMRAVPPLPSCPRCGGLARPNILMFGDFGWVSARTDAQAREHAGWLRSLRGSRVVVVEIGAGTAVPTVRRHAELNAAATGALIRINTREPAVRHGHGVPIPLPAADALHRMDALLP